MEAGKVLLQHRSVRNLTGPIDAQMLEKLDRGTWPDFIFFAPVGGSWEYASALHEMFRLGRHCNGDRGQIILVGDVDYLGLYAALAFSLPNRWALQTTRVFIHRPEEMSDRHPGCNTADQWHWTVEAETKLSDKDFKRAVTGQKLVSNQVVNGILTW